MGGEEKLIIKFAWPNNGVLYLYVVCNRSKE